MKQVTLIIRSVGERTEEACRELIVRQVPNKQIFLIRISPFSRALKRSFEIGIKENRKWTLCIDADVLLKDDAVKELVSEAEKHKEKLFELQGMVLDKFFGGPRPAGNHLYRTRHLSEAIKLIPEDEPIRPETETINLMEEKGFQWCQSKNIIGLHDFEQYEKDIYRKCFVQAKKHAYLIDNLFKPIWKEREGGGKDKDFKIALKGLDDGVSHETKVTIDVGNDYFQHKFTAQKKPLDVKNIQKFVNDKINTFKIAKEYNKHFRKRTYRFVKKKKGLRLLIKLYKMFTKMGKAN